MEDDSVDNGGIVRRILWIPSRIRCLGVEPLTVKALGRYVNLSGSDTSS
jgi:hypothetical protein